MKQEGMNDQGGKNKVNWRIHGLMTVKKKKKGGSQLTDTWVFLSIY
jgi:hypothetical protein